MPINLIFTALILLAALAPPPAGVMTPEIVSNWLLGICTVVMGGIVGLVGAVINLNIKNLELTVADSIDKAVKKLSEEIKSFLREEYVSKDDCRERMDKCVAKCPYYEEVHSGGRVPHPNTRSGPGVGSTEETKECERGRMPRRNANS